MTAQTIPPRLEDLPEKKPRRKREYRIGLPNTDCKETLPVYYVTWAGEYQRVRIPPECTAYRLGTSGAWEQISSPWRQDDEEGCWEEDEDEEGCGVEDEPLPLGQSKAAEELLELDRAWSSVYISADGDYYVEGRTWRGQPQRLHFRCDKGHVYLHRETTMTTTGSNTRRARTKTIRSFTLDDGLYAAVLSLRDELGSDEYSISATVELLVRASLRQIGREPAQRP